MTQNEESRQEKGIFYGWYIVAASFLILFLNSGAMYSFGVVFKPIVAEFGWGRGPVSLVFFVNMVVFALAIAVTGRLYDRYGPKWVIVVCSLFVCVGLILTAFMTTFWHFVLAYGLLVAIGFGGTSISLMGAIISRWFVARRGLAVSLAIAGFCLGQFVIVPLFTMGILRFGWRLSYALLGLTSLALNSLLAFLVIKDGKPRGFLRNSLVASVQLELSSPDDPRDTAPRVRDLGLREALRTRSYWLFLIVMFLCGSHDFFVTTHLVPFATDNGVTAATASNMLAWFGLLGFPGVLIAGPMADRTGVKAVVVLSFVLRVLAFLMIFFFTDHTSIWAFALIIGFSSIMTAPLNPVLMGKLYGLSHLGLLSGAVVTLHHMGGGFWAFVGGMLFDSSGDYRLAFLLSAVTSAIAVLCTLLIKERRHCPE
jgi:MFS family permease